jgi:hypothetical protein
MPVSYAMPATATARTGNVSFRQQCVYAPNPADSNPACPTAGVASCVSNDMPHWSGEMVCAPATNCGTCPSPKGNHSSNTCIFCTIPGASGASIFSNANAFGGFKKPESFSLFCNGSLDLCAPPNTVYAPSVSYQTLHCPGPDVNCPFPGYTFDPKTRYCLCGNCGTDCYCPATGTCIPCPAEPPCWQQRGCYIDAATCQWTCPDVVLCAETWTFNYTTCLCEPCPAGTCNCQDDGCVDCTPPDCAEELNCTWDPVGCEWECDEPSCPGQCWDPTTCTCGTCPAGYECCNGICIPVTDPACKTERSCTWNSTTCSWDCTTPSCPDGQHYDLTICDCVEGFDGVWLVESEITFVFRACEVGGDVRVDRTRDGGFTWEPVTVATDASEGAVPSLAVDQFDHLYVLYHNPSDHLRIWKSRDWAWTDWVTRTDQQYRYPVAAFGPKGLYLAFWRDVLSGQVRIAYSEDYGVTIGGDEFIFSVAGLPEQIPQLRTDKWGTAHLYYKDGSGNILHRWATDPGSDVLTDPGDWTQVETLTSGDYPSPALGLTTGYMVNWDLVLTVPVLEIDRLAEGFGAPIDILSWTVTPDWAAPQYLGAMVDHQENLWLIGKREDTGMPRVAVTPVESVGGALRMRELAESTD